MPPLGDLWRLPPDQLEVELTRLPSVVTYSRLEPMSLSPDLTPGLQAILGDPLWLIGRQWQFDELRGEDGGTPIAAVLEVEQARLSRLHPGAPGPNPAGESVNLVDDDMPLEPLVEAEAVATPPDRVRAQAGLQLLRMLAAANLAQLRAKVVTRWAFQARPDDAEDRSGTARATVLVGRVPDAGRVAAELGPLATAAGPLKRLPTGFAVPGGAAGATKAQQVLGAWLKWYRGFFVAPAGHGSWNPHRQEYSFATQAELPSGQAVLSAPEYKTGHLDWPDFDAVAGPALGATPPRRKGTSTRQVLLPTPARFPGMPADRLWQFEDANVYLGGIDAGPTDLARMALVEFSLTFGVDWFVLPVDVNAGSVLRVGKLNVSDTFGVDIQVGPAREPGGWSMFGLTPSTADPRLADLFVIPPVLPHVLESDPLEEVALFRDEMANLVWGVERVVQGPSGEPFDRRRVSSPVSLRQTLPGDLADASIVYRLMSPVPDYWVPFVAVPAPGQPAGAIELERRPLIHFRNGTTDTTHPRGVLLLSAPDADRQRDRLRLAEEEVPRDGAVVTRGYQLARTPSGGTVAWIGRRKRTGEGEGWSGLRFDTALPPGSSD